eukprot:2133164-Amphidinium_carterae.1
MAELPGVYLHSRKHNRASLFVRVVRKPGSSCHAAKCGRKRKHLNTVQQYGFYFCTIAFLKNY